MTPAGTRASRWLLDTSVLIDIGAPGVASGLPEATAISVVTLAELTAGPLMTDDATERAVRQQRLLDVASMYDPIPVDEDVASAFGAVAAAVHRAGRQPRKRQFDLLIAAVAVAHGLPLATRNADDLVGLEDTVDVRAI